jgi:murein DD-endopeptidase MepM/ murein hydrolase activator NlpD
MLALGLVAGSTATHAYHLMRVFLAPSRPDRVVTAPRIPTPPQAPAPAATAPEVAEGEPAGAPDPLLSRALQLPVAGVDARTLSNTFEQARGSARHEAIDILAPRGTPVVAVDDGHVEKLFTSDRGGLTVYQFDPSGTYCYYYAHLDAYAPGLREGQVVRKGDPLGTVGTSGNASPETPHLHFAIFALGPEKRWWEGTPLNPYPLWATR